METIIYTNSKREAANYQVDKICFADRVDIGQVIEQQMNRYNIRHLNLWFISSNLTHLPGTSPTKLLLSMARYLSENKDMPFDFQYLVEKYHSFQPAEKRNTEQQSEQKDIDQRSIFKVTRNESNGLLDGKRRDSEDLSPTLKYALRKEELIREQLSYGNASELESFLQKEQCDRVENDMVKNFIFKSKSETIKISFIEPNKKQFLKKIIDFANDQIYDAKLHLKKKFTCLFEDHSSIKYHQLFPAAYTFHNKLILFLFQNDRNQQLPRKQKVRSNFKPNYSLQALQEWKINEENINVTSKLERECELIKQEIESERIAFRNKIKALENFIGQAINVEKLLQEEDDDQKSKFQPTQTSSSSFKKAQKSKKMSFSQTASKNNLAPLQTVTSQFKRLKDIADAMRNIDNTLLEQNRKIQSGKAKQKQLIKSKESLLYTNARELNKLKAEILELESEIKRKELEVDERMKKGDFVQIARLKDKKPTSKARLKLQEHRQFINRLKGVQGTEKTLGQAHQPQKNSKQTKRTHEDRITHRSHHIPRNHTNVDAINLMLRYKEKKIKEAADTQMNATKMKQEGKLRKNALIKPFTLINQSCNGQNCCNTSQNPSQDQHLVRLLTEQLMELYRYYSKNRMLMSKMKKEIQSYKLVQHPRPFIFKDSHNLSKSQLRCSKSQQFDMSLLDTFQQLNFAEFPILSQHLNTDKSVKLVSGTNGRSNTQLSRTYKQQYNYNGNYFDLMIEKENRSVGLPLGYPEALSSVASQLQDRVIEPELKEAPEIKITPATKFKPKRITIEQAINFNYKNLRFSKIN